jgi:hypothetical protein
MSHINNSLFLYGSYNDGHFGNEESIDDCSTFRSFAGIQKYVFAAASIQKALFQNDI